MCSENYGYKKHMCKTCIYFENFDCKLERIPVICARKGLKNKEGGYDICSKITPKN